jgi:hypothetical protein
MSDTVLEIELSMDMAKKKIELLEVLERLKENPDFKAFVSVGFMGEERIRDLLTKKVSPSFQDVNNKMYVDSQLQAIGAFRMFTLYVEQEGRMAKQALTEAEEERNRALEEVAA